MKVLMLRDNPVYDLESDTAIQPYLLPLGVNHSMEAIMHWLKKRALSTSRKGYSYLSQLIAPDPANWNYASLSDSFWLKTKDVMWKEISLYEKFSEDIGQALLTRRSSLQVRSPEWTTTGIYLKYWKSGSPSRLVKMDGAQAEYDSYLIASQLGFSHQTVEKLDKHAECLNFTDPIVSLVPFAYCGLSMREIQQMFPVDFANMCIHDYLIYNRDRHNENWGLLMDNFTGKYISLAPLFDHNLALSSNEDEEELMSQQFPLESLKEVAIRMSKRYPLHSLETSNQDVMTRYNNLTHVSLSNHF